jgi:hypothetical protein
MNEPVLTRHHLLPLLAACASRPTRACRGGITVTPWLPAPEPPPRRRRYVSLSLDEDGMQAPGSGVDHAPLAEQPDIHMVQEEC